MTSKLRLLGWAAVLFPAAIAGGVLALVWSVAVPLVALLAGVPLTLLAAVLVRRFADLHRRWAAGRLGQPIARTYRAADPGAGWLARLSTVLRDPATWRDFAWLLVNAVTGCFTAGLPLLMVLCGFFYLLYPLLFAITPPAVLREPFGAGFVLHGVGQSFVLVPLGPALLVLWWVTAVRLGTWHALVVRAMLGPPLRDRVEELTASRADVVDTQAGELRRIERDLHDGAQARLAALGMSLGLAEQMLPDDPAAAGRLLAEARETTAGALSELRDLVRGIHPPVLADRGIDGALRALALANPIPTTVVTRLPGRLPTPVESAAYFAVAEALANAVKHASAATIRIEVELAAGHLRMLVADDGIGGASLDAGTGLRGVARRLSAFDGTLNVDSPAGGPTAIRMALPCASS